MQGVVTLFMQVKDAKLLQVLHSLPSVPNSQSLLHVSLVQAAGANLICADEEANVGSASVLACLASPCLSSAYICAGHCTHPKNILERSQQHQKAPCVT